MITKAQKELLTNLDNGYEVTFRDGHYVTTFKDKLSSAKLWPTTFYGLYDQGMVERLENGNYTISMKGKEEINGNS